MEFENNLNKDDVLLKWESTKKLIENLISNEDYTTHIEPLKVDFFNNKIILFAINDLSKQIIKNNYLKMIKELFKTQSGYNIEFILESQNVLTASEPIKEEKPVVVKPKQHKNYDEYSMELNNEFCFEDFIEGNNNRMAKASAISVANKPGTLYNPLFIYGDSGLGKTHLMQAIGNMVKSNQPYSKIFYSTGEHFTSLYVEAVKQNKVQAFRQKIRNYDLFLLDDIQFLVNKESTTNEFFHTFNTLFDTGKQIVLTSDRAPKELNMDERLLSRFEQGLFTDVKKPDFENRLAILQDKAKKLNTIFPNEVLEYIARLIKDNIRKLMGALTRLSAQSSLLNEEITIDFAKQVLDSYYNNNPKVIDIESIQENVAKYFNVTVTDLRGQSRTKDLVHARQIAMYLSRELTEQSLPSIGKHFGGRDHATVIHSIKKIEEQIQTDPTIKQKINEISAQIVN